MVGSDTILISVSVWYILKASNPFFFIKIIRKKLISLVTKNLYFRAIDTYHMLQEKSDIPNFRWNIVVLTFSVQNTCWWFHKITFSWIKATSMTNEVIWTLLCIVSFWNVNMVSRKMCVQILYSYLDEWITKQSVCFHVHSDISVILQSLWVVCDAVHAGALLWLLCCKCSVDEISTHILIEPVKYLLISLPTWNHTDGRNVALW